MSIERLELDDDQWIDIERRPTHGMIRKIARETLRASKGPDPLEGEDLLVLNLVSAWDVKDGNGNPVQLRKASFEDVPQDVWGRIVDECTNVLETAIPNPQPRTY